MVLLSMLDLLDVSFVYTLTLCILAFNSSQSCFLEQISARLSESIPRILPQLESKLQALQERQTQLQMLQPKIDEVPHLLGWGRAGVEGAVAGGEGLA